MHTHAHTRVCMHVCMCTHTHIHTHTRASGKTTKTQSGNVVLSTLADNCTCLSTSRQEAPGSCPLNVHVIKTNCVHNLLNWYNWYTWTINWYAVDVFWAWQVHDSTWNWTKYKRLYSCNNPDRSSTKQTNKTQNTKCKELSLTEGKLHNLSDVVHMLCTYILMG